LQPYEGFKLLEKKEHIFIPLPGLQNKYIIRAHEDLKGFDAYYSNTGFEGFPRLMHHAHPYFVIANALPKLERHISGLEEEPRIVCGLMHMIFRRWQDRLNDPGTQKRRRDDLEEGSVDEEDDSQPRDKKHNARKRDSKDNKGKTRARPDGKVYQMHRQLQTT
jgi:hypothetical protein